MPDVWDITFRHSASIKRWNSVNLPPTQFYRVDLGVDPHKTFYIVGSGKDQVLEGGDYWWLQVSTYRRDDLSGRRLTTQGYLHTLKDHNIDVDCKYPHDESVSGPVIAGGAEEEVKEDEKDEGDIEGEQETAKDVCVAAQTRQTYKAD